MASCLSSEHRDGVSGPRSMRSTTTFDMDVEGLVEGTGQWENMQSVLRSAIKMLLDGQTAHEKQVQQMQAVLISTRRLVGDKASREEVARLATDGGDTAAVLGTLRADVYSSREESKAEASDMMSRLEGKASKEHVAACLEGKANQGEVLELRGRLGRLCSGAGLVETRGRQALHDKALALEKRLGGVEARLCGCEAHAVRADPGAVALRIETVASGLNDLRKRVDGKADARATARALEEKPDRTLLQTALKAKADRADLSTIEVTAASLLAVSRERASVSTSLKQDIVACASAASTALQGRTDSLEQRMERVTGDLDEAREGERSRADLVEKRARGVDRRLDRVEAGLRTVAAATAGAAEKAAKAVEAAGRCKRRDLKREDSSKAVADVVEALAKRVEECDNPARHMALSMEGMVESKFSESSKKIVAHTLALTERVVVLEQSVGKELSAFSEKLSAVAMAAASAAQAAASAAEAAAAAAAREQQQQGDERRQRQSKGKGLVEGGVTVLATCDDPGRMRATAVTPGGKGAASHRPGAGAAAGGFALTSRRVEEEEPAVRHGQEETRKRIDGARTSSWSLRGERNRRSSPRVATAVDGASRRLRNGSNEKEDVAAAAAAAAAAASSFACTRESSCPPSPFLPPPSPTSSAALSSPPPETVHTTSTTFRDHRWSENSSSSRGSDGDGDGGRNSAKPAWTRGKGAANFSAADQGVSPESLEGVGSGHRQDRERKGSSPTNEGSAAQGYGMRGWGSEGATGRRAGDGGAIRDRRAKGGEVASLSPRRSTRRMNASIRAIATKKGDGGDGGGQRTDKVFHKKASARENYGHGLRPEAHYDAVQRQQDSTTPPRAAAAAAAAATAATSLDSSGRKSRRRSRRRSSGKGGEERGDGDQELCPARSAAARHKAYQTRIHMSLQSFSGGSSGESTRDSDESTSNGSGGGGGERGGMTDADAVKRRLGELRREKEAFREVVARGT